MPAPSAVYCITLFTLLTGVQELLTGAELQKPYCIIGTILAAL